VERVPIKGGDFTRWGTRTLERGETYLTTSPFQQAGMTSTNQFRSYTEGKPHYYRVGKGVKKKAF